LRFCERTSYSNKQIKFGSFCRKHPIGTLSLFGSILTSHFGPKSDVDILVSFNIERIPKILLIKLLNFLEKLMRRTLQWVDKVSVKSSHMASQLALGLSIWVGPSGQI
jgi:predicted nucleotidyltransferase